MVVSPLQNTASGRTAGFLAAMPGTRGEWQAISRCYRTDSDCLASYLALELAEVLQGVKPANLVCLANKRHACGRNLYLLWKANGASLLEDSGLKVRVLCDRGSSLLLLLYSPEALDALLGQKSVQVILAKAGYQRPAELEAALSELENRVVGDSFPHEIGVFLGYPLKDVVGFMGWAPLRFTCQGPWKIFGNAAESLKLAEAHRKCRCRAALLLASGCSPVACLRKSHPPFFSAVNENEYPSLLM